MMPNGVIRRVDSLGRIVIPIHMRKRLMINENDNVEIFLDENNHIVLDKYSTLKGSGEMFHKIAISIYEKLAGTVLITDLEMILASYGKKRMSYAPGSLLDNEVVDLMRIKTHSQKQTMMIKLNQEELEASVVFPVYLLDNPIGSIIFIRKEALDDGEIKTIETFALLISNMMKG